MNFKLVLADDEPLVLVGLQSMLDWEALGVSIVGAARNGGQLLELITSASPDIVITDIRMPVMSGLEVMSECRTRFGRVPLFIVLTSHEEYAYVKEAIGCQAVNYLVKIDLTPEILAESVTRAVSILHDIRRNESVPTVDPAGQEPFRDKFFFRLLCGLVETREQFVQQKQDLGLEVSPKLCCAAYCEICGLEAGTSDKDKLVNLYSSTVGIVRETVSQYLACIVVSLDMRHFGIIFHPSDEWTEGMSIRVRKALEHASTLVRNYFAVSLRCSVGNMVDDLFRIDESFAVARRIQIRPSLPGQIAVFDPGEVPDAPSFDMGGYRDDLARSLQELDMSGFSRVLKDIREDLGRVNAGHAAVMDVACSILFMAISLLPDGEELVSSLFEAERAGYRCIYEYKTSAECLSWIGRLEDGLTATLTGRRQDYRLRVVAKVQRYIDANVGKKLTLGEVASVFGFSQNYLSTMFTKYGGTSFVEYTTRAKISAAKKLLARGELRIHEISERLGFESAFYFSKVFKKIEGCSPREYMQQQESP